MMLSNLFLPENAAVQVDSYEIDTHRLVLHVSGTNLAATCPYCGTESTRINGVYYRKPADLPCIGYVVQLHLRVRCFFCDNSHCGHRTFAEQFPEAAAPYARRTVRLREQQQRVAFEASGEAAARILAMLGMPVSGKTLLRLVRSAPEASTQTPRVLGVDDWAMKKGQSYGTILINQETGRPVELLPECSAEVLAQWLSEHPGVEIITRDRAGDYAAGATTGAPDALQVADRFHLLQNLTDMLKRMFERQPKQLREATRQAAAKLSSLEEPTTRVTVPADAANEPASHEVESSPADSVRQSAAHLRFDEVKSLQEQGWSQRAIAAHLQINWRTVRKYWSLDVYPKRQPGPQTISSVTPYLPYLIRRWHEGCQRCNQLFEEVRTQGYTGSYASVWRALRQLKAEGTIITLNQDKPQAIPPLSARRAAWLFSTPADELTPEQQSLRDALLDVCPDAAHIYDLAQSFGDMIRNRTVEAFDDWLRRTTQCAVGEFQRFAESLQRDYAAVKAALQYAWSNGRVEGHVNRLKCIKRQSYGRANFDLLRKRVLGFPEPTCFRPIHRKCPRTTLRAI